MAKILDFYLVSNLYESQRTREHQSEKKKINSRYICLAFCEEIRAQTRKKKCHKERNLAKIKPNLGATRERTTEEITENFFFKDFFNKKNTINWRTLFKKNFLRNFLKNSKEQIPV